MKGKAPARAPKTATKPKLTPKPKVVEDAAAWRSQQEAARARDDTAARAYAGDVSRYSRAVSRVPDAERRGGPARVRARQGRPARARRADPLRHARRGRLAGRRRVRDRSQALQDARGAAHAG